MLCYTNDLFYKKHVTYAKAFFFKVWSSKPKARFSSFLLPYVVFLLVECVWKTSSLGPFFYIYYHVEFISFIPHNFFSWLLFGHWGWINKETHTFLLRMGNTSHVIVLKRRRLLLLDNVGVNVPTTYSHESNWVDYWIGHY
jgi:hypothetical protein